jgi:aryl-alcohol dehydrogenase-like predicted oxidoreductase
LRKISLFPGGPDVSVLGVRVAAAPMAPWPRFGEQCLYEVKRLNEAPTLEMLRAALDAGINFFDTDWASGNGHAEEIMGKALRGHAAVISSKGGPRFDFSGKLIHDNSRANLMNQAEDSRQRLGVTCIDIYSVNGHDDAAEIKQTARGLADLAHTGRVASLGAAEMPAAALRELATHAPLKVVQGAFSLLQREFAAPAFCKARGIGFVATDVLARGILAGEFTGKEQFPEIDPARAGPLFKAPLFERATAFAGKLAEFAKLRGTTREVLAIAWVLAQPGVTCALIEPRSVDELKSWARAGELELSEADKNALPDLLKSA